MTDLIYPTIDLFIYDLIKSLGDTDEKIKENQEYFKSKLPENIAPELWEFERDLEVTYAYLLKNKEKILPLKLKNKFYSFDGYYFPVRLGDSYGLLIDFALDNKTEPQPARCFADIKDKFENHILKSKTGTLGQTWMISGWLPPSPTRSSEEIEEIAKACYRALMPELKWEEELNGKGQFLGATVFELSGDRLAKQIIKSQEKEVKVIHNNQHVIIAIYPDEVTYNRLGEFYSDWMRLFYYRQKILWAYGQSKILNESMKTYFANILKQSESIDKNLNQRHDLKKLKNILSALQNNLNQYHTQFNILIFQSGTIEINASNYQKRLEIINRKAKENTNLIFLADFTKSVNEVYLLQIKKDSENFERGLRLLENINDGVKNQVEVEKTKSDRNFQDIVAVVGSSVATVSFLKEGKNECKVILKALEFNDLSICESPLFYSVPISIAVGLVVLWLRKRSL